MGLRSRVMLSLAAAVTVSSVLAWQLFSWFAAESVRARLLGRATIIAEALEASLLGRDLGKPAAGAAAGALLERFLAADRELVYIVLIDESGKLLTWAPRDGAPLGFDFTTTSEGLTSLVEQHLRAAPDDDLVRATLDSKAGGLPARVLVGLTAEMQLGQLGAIVANTALFIGLTALLLLWVAFGRLFGRVQHLKGYAGSLAMGDLTQHVEDRSKDELGDLARALESIVQNLGQTISGVRSASLQLDGLSQRVRDASRQIAGDAGTQGSAVHDTGTAIRKLYDASGAVEGQITQVTASAEQTVDRLRQISNAAERVAVSLKHLSVSVDGMRKHLAKSTDSLAQVDTAVDGLNEVAESTASAASEITASINAVERNTRQALELSKTAAERAESGVTAVKESLEGIHLIRSSADETVRVLRGLSEKVGSIENILGVINDIANQTKLLSLNASIIAAQAGEHGRGFLVVAEEIKALAQKTAGSTRAIAEVIHEAQRNSASVIATVEHGLTTVAEGVGRSEHADRVLSDIQESVSATANLVRSIVSAINEQARGAVHVDRAMQEVHSTAVRVRQIVSAQQDEGQQLQRAMAQMTELMTTVMAVADEQSSQVLQATHAIRQIFEKIRAISEMNQNQAGSREQLSRTFKVLEELSERNREGARGLAVVVDQAAAHSRTLADGVRVFKV